MIYGMRYYDIWLHGLDKQGATNVECGQRQDMTGYINIRKKIESTKQTARNFGNVQT